MIMISEACIAELKEERLGMHIMNGRELGEKMVKYKARFSKILTLIAVCNQDNHGKHRS
jgi:hypothetical protein